ncbi:protein kinase [Streptomyces sp. TG1A-8]|uniref:protein kinase n=1 Tax=Streptomyces sp. TG1A-8 TaxID=3051385 RepID=UPI00265BAFF8|nr:protein kinase [Streptomyces sp. TG1A-8]MDO0926168.1 protein kinase [Streptomyces sp. TG1A-8]
MDDYAGRVLADRYRLPLPPSDEYELTETPAFDTYSGQEVLVRQVLLPEVVEAEVLDAEGLPEGFTARAHGARRGPAARAATRRPSDPAVRRAVEAVQAVAGIPDHPRLDQVFDVFAEGGSLWIVSELVPARPLASLLAEEPLSPYRAAEVASDVLMALRVLHAHGWVHRNITARTVLVCDDGRVLLTGLAVGAAEEALCGYDPVPAQDAEADGAGPVLPAGGSAGGPGAGVPGAGGGPGALPGPVPGPVPAAGGPGDRGLPPSADADPEAARRAAIQARAAGGLPVPGAGGAAGGAVGTGPAGRCAPETGEDIRAARAGAIAAYRAGARAAARVQETQQNGPAELPAGRPAAGAVPALPAGAAGGPGAGRWDEPGAGGSVRRGPGTALAAERARQVRMTVVGPVTERWAPEQAVPVHENWQLAAPVGPATDLWALGALLFRAVQGHAPYPEESTAELVQLVCAEPPAFAEECGPLRPVVESLLRQDPTDRLDFEDLGGWLRSLVRSAPEPDAGSHVVPVPPDPRRLPIVRRRGELVRRWRRNGAPAAPARHKRARQEAPAARSPRSLGRTLVLLVLLLLAGAVAYAMVFMPKDGPGGAAADGHTGDSGRAGSAPSGAQPSAGQDAPDGDPPESAPAAETQTGGDPSVADGFTLRTDPDGFRVAVAKGWQRTPRNGSAQVVYAHEDFELIVVPGRDSASANGGDPMAYQRDKERELQPYRDSSWATATGLRTIEVGGRTMAEGQFTWTDDQGRDLYVRNMAILLDGRYHIVQVRGPEAERDEVTRLYEQATATYRYTG